MVFCSACGAANQNGKFCSNCGSAISAPVNSTPIEKPIMDTTPNTPPVSVDTGLKCALCDKAILSQYISMAFGDIHPECFKCGSCGNQITGGYGYKDGNHKNPLCENCGGRKQGFTVDPRTGKKTFR
eukprot:TRINITY_DN7845_c0_g1_i2.p1 TRINITY_DN7845_c0_g1~~TRINITY_DN7845_c0_g1_i2.p1  ORF type:complete len:127 (-),score=22.75 TRINITY_DN7845_c0_g1_i2:79-459(-)